MYLEAATARCTRVMIHLVAFVLRSAHDRGSISITIRAFLKNERNYDNVSAVVKSVGVLSDV